LLLGKDQALALQATGNLYLLVDLQLLPFLTFILRDLWVQ